VEEAVAAEPTPEPVVEVAPEPKPVIVVAPAEPDPAEISAPPAAPRKGWWRR
jgi:ribonuclease E